MSGNPDSEDYSSRVDLVAQSIGDLAVDVATQSLGTLGVDVEAQSVGDVAVNLASQTGDVAVNLASQSGDVAVDLASQSVSNLGIDIEAQSISDLGIDIQNQSLSELSSNTEINGSEGLIVESRTVRVDVPAGGQDITVISPPSDEIWELQALRIFIRDDPSSTSGSHSIEVRVGTGNTNILFAEANHDTDIEYNSGEFFQTYQTTRPSTSAAQEGATTNVRVDGDNELQLLYQNDTDETNFATREYDAVFRRITIA